ncbi:DNA primase [Candidatus Uhrbacteria bacterium]|nr:DNA primase [Candidatus Uhrbacteria bacterium]
MSTVDDIKSKIDLADYLREQGIQLKPAGSSLKACCPFHNEKTPSFMVNRAKQVYHCFGCSKGGDLFTFVQEREGLEFGEALRLLAERAGVKLEARDPRLEGRKTRSLGVLELAAKWFHHQLTKSSVGETARAYVAKRGIATETVEQFQIGYAPDAWDTLSTFLVQRGFTTQEAVEAGLGIAGQRVGSTYDRFRHRLMFPIHDAMGRVVGFTGRILDGGKTSGPSTSLGEKASAPAKYVNTPETALYKKGAILYGLWFARDAIRKEGFAVLVEGQMDVIACHEHGVEHTIAVSGTALTPEQLRLLKRYTTRLHLAFDADPAGEGAAERSIDAALDIGFDVRVIRMPVGTDGKPIAKDADECIRKDAEAWRQVVANPIPVLDHFLDRIRQRFDLHQPIAQRDAGRLIVQHLVHVVDPIERAAWVRRSAEVIGVPESAVLEAVARNTPRSASPAPVSTVTAPDSSSDPLVRLSERFLALCLRFPTDAATAITSVPTSALPESHRQLYEAMLAGYTSGQSTTTPTDGFVDRLELLADREFAELSAEVITQEIAHCAHALRRHHITTELRHIAHQLKTLERLTGHAAPAEEVTALERTFHALTQELATLN